MSVESQTVEPQPVHAATPLSQPLYGATIGQAVTRFFTKYATFSGRASRSEFWWFYLAYLVVGAVIVIPLNATGITSVTVTDGQIVYGPGYWLVWTIGMIVTLALVVPFLALIWRRLHDTDRSGGFFFLSLIPVVGPIILLVLLALPDAGSRFEN